MNEKFCAAVLAQARPADAIWVQDYQLLLLPKLLRRARPEASMGFFWHIPFPLHELIRVLPWRNELLRGMLGANLIGFHAFGYMRHFLSSVAHALGLPAQNGRIENGNRSVRVDAFPMGIDYERYAQAAGSAEPAHGRVGTDEGQEGAIADHAHVIGAFNHKQNLRREPGGCP